MTSKEVLRAKYKRLYKECLVMLTKKDAFIEYWKKLGLYQEGYHLDQIQEKHANDAINILCYQFSSSGTTTTHPIFMNTVISKAELFKSKVNWAIKTGTGIVVLNKYNKVCAVSTGHDICDQDPNQYTSKDKKMLHLFELITRHENNTDIWRKKIGDKKEQKQWKMGQVYYGGYGAVAPSLAHKGLMRHSLSRIISGMMGYKYHYAIMANKITIKWAQRMNKLSYIYASKPFDFNNFIFNDGTKMNDYYNELETKYGFTKQYVEKVKNQSHICLYIMDFTNIGNKTFEGWIEIWKQCIAIINTKIQLSKL